MYSAVTPDKQLGPCYLNRLLAWELTLDACAHPPSPSPAAPHVPTANPAPARVPLSRTQILYLADISMVCMQLELRPGERGTRSRWHVTKWHLGLGPLYHVFSYCVQQPTRVVGACSGDDLPLSHSIGGCRRP